MVLGGGRMSKQPEQESERRWPMGLRVRPVGWRFFDWPGGRERYGSLVGTVVAPTYSLSTQRRIDWWRDGGGVWAIDTGWEVEPIPPIWVRQGRPKPPPVNHVENWGYSRNHRRVAVYLDESWRVEVNGVLVEKFSSWRAAIYYANELAYNRC